MGKFAKYLRAVAFELKVDRMFTIRFAAEWRLKHGRKPTKDELKTAIAEYMEKNPTPRVVRPIPRLRSRGFRQL